MPLDSQNPSQPDLNLQNQQAMLAGNDTHNYTSEEKSCFLGQNFS
jgi:hypothetical protein